MAKRDLHNVEAYMRRGKETLERLPYERFMQGFEFSGAFLPPLQHGKKSAGNFKAM